MKGLRNGLIFLVLTVFCGLSAQAAITYTVNKSGGGNYTDLNACIAAFNAGTETDVTVHFTDTAVVVYDLNPAQTVFTNGLHVTMTADTGSSVTVNGRLDVAQGGGTFTASNMGFKNAQSQWAFIHGYDGQSYTNCTFGPSSDNGLVIRGGTNTITNCTFRGVQNNAMIISGGNTTLTNIYWGNNGTMMWTEGADNSGTIVINGGSAYRQAGKENNGIRLTGGPKVTMNNVITNGMKGSIQHDFESGNAYLTANGCQFLGGWDSPVMCFINTNDGKVTQITLNDCVLDERVADSGNLVSVDCRGNADSPVVTLNRCLLKHGAANNSGLVAWKGGTVNANNCVITGCNNGALVTSEGSGHDATMNINHCTFVKSGDKTTSPTIGNAIAVGNFAKTNLTVKNSIIDASCAAGIDVGAAATATVDYNLINTTKGNTTGTHVFTGDPAFVDFANGNYHLGDNSAAINKGVVTSVTDDFEKKARPMPAGTVPDLGAFENQELVPVELSSFGIE